MFSTLKQENGIEEHKPKGDVKKTLNRVPRELVSYFPSLGILFINLVLSKVHV
jgi:hypothetical protein